MSAIAASDPVGQAYSRCMERWPGIGLPPETFRERVAACAAVPARLSLEDLFLATACARGDRVAWEHFADEYLPVLRRLAGQACRCIEEGEDLAQGIVLSLLDRPEKIAGYDGRASLPTWMRAIVARAAIDRFRSSRREVPVEDPPESCEERPTAVAEADSSLDREWVKKLLAELSIEISALSSNDRLLLGLYYRQGVPLQALGRQFNAHEATVSRRLDRLRRHLRHAVENTLRRRHGLKPGEIAGLWQAALLEGGLALAEIPDEKCKPERKDRLSIGGKR